MRHRPPGWIAGLGALFLLFAVYLVASSLDRPTPPVFPPTPRAPAPPAAGTTEARRITLDAREPDRWVRFDFSRGTPVPDPGPRDWDLAARRFRVVVNGGEGYPGGAGAIDLGDVPLDSLGTLPAEGYVGTRRRPGGEPQHPVLDGWYRYDFFSHLLRPRPRTFALRTADGRYAAIRFLGYYCPGVEAGCLTFRYRYRGDGGRDF